MNFRIVKKDLTKKKSMSFIIMIFILLATMFIAASVNNMIIVMNGTDSFFEMSGLDDFFIFTMRESTDADRSNEDTIIEGLNNSRLVESFTEDSIAYMAKSNLCLSDGKIANVSSTMILSSCTIKNQKFFDDSNHEITSVKSGMMYVPRSFMEKNELKKGDIIEFKSTDGYNKKFVIAGIAKDAMLGSDMMGTHRYIVSDEDFNDIYYNAGLPAGSLFSIKSDDPDKLKTELNEIDFTSIFADGKKIVKLSYIMDMVIAGVLLIVSFCLIIISVVMLRFIIVFNVNEEFRQIGIMKAIGIKNSGIRGIYVGKFLVLSVIGALLGFIGSIPFSNILMKQVTRNIVVTNGKGSIILSVIISILVAAMITGFAYLSTRRIKKLSPMDAIRNGSTGERFKKKSPLKLHKSGIKATSFMAVNDVMSELKKYIVLLITGIVGIWLLIMPINTINTLDSEKIAKWFSVLDCDIYIQDDVKITDCINGNDKKLFDEYLDSIKSELEAEGMEVERVFMEELFKFRIRKDDDKYNSFAIQGIGTDTTEYVYEEGSAPVNTNEVALGYTTKKAINAKVGDKVYITFNGEEQEFIVTGFYQTMNNMGEGIRFHQDTLTDQKGAGGAFATQVVFKGNPTKAEIDKYIGKIKEIYPAAVVTDVKGFISNMIGNITDMLAPIKIMVIAIVIAINVLVVVLMQKMFLIREKNKMATLKAIGYSNKDLIIWQTKRITFVLFIGILIGTITATPFSQITSGQVFKLMGATRIEFVINPLEVYLIYPLAVLLATIAGCILTMRKVKKITVSDINVVE